MNEEEVKKYEGKKCLIILKNNFKYTATIPSIENNYFSIVDKYGKEVSIDVSFIAMISEVQND